RRTEIGEGGGDVGRRSVWCGSGRRRATPRGAGRCRIGQSRAGERRGGRRGGERGEPASQRRAAGGAVVLVGPRRLLGRGGRGGRRRGERGDPACQQLAAGGAWVLIGHRRLLVRGGRSGQVPEAAVGDRGPGGDLPRPARSPSGLWRLQARTATSPPVRCAR